MSVQPTAVRFNTSSIQTVNTNLVNLSSGVNTLSTNVGRVFSTQSLSFITSNITLSNAATSPNYQGYALTSYNAGLQVFSDQFAGISVFNTTGNIAEITFNTVTSGGVFSAFGSGDATRGAYWFVGGVDAINVGTSGNVSIKNAGVVNSNYTLYVNGQVGVASTLTITGGGLQVTNSTLANSVFFSTNLTMYNGNFLQSNANSVTSYATFYSTAMTVHGSISTTGTLLCLGRLNTPNVANVSTLIVGDNITSTARTSLDIYGSYRSRVQTFSTNSEIQVNGGNWIYAKITSNITLNLPELDTAQTGVGFWMHKSQGHTVIFSTTGAGGTINNAGNTYTALSAKEMISIICLGASDGWQIVAL